MRRLITTIALVTLGSSAMAGNEQRVYKWTDDEGNVHFSDSIPAEHAERRKEVLNGHGVTVEELEGKKTAEQLEQERIENEVRVAQELQRRADQALLAGNFIGRRRRQESHAHGSAAAGAERALLSPRIEAGQDHCRPGRRE